MMAAFLVPGALDDVDRRQDGAQVEDRGPGRDQQEVGQGCHMDRVRLYGGAGVHDRQIDPVLARGVQDVPEAVRGGLDQLRRFRLASLPPDSRGTLEVLVDQQDAPPHLLRGHRMMDRQRRLAGAALPGQQPQNPHPAPPA
jgi:hypothetical protein